MTNILYCFDTEDFTSNSSADAISILADLLEKEGVRANFCITGLLAKQLIAWDRKDILKSLKPHEIQLHSFGHSLHPTINEYTDIKDFEKAYSRCKKEETLAEQYVKEATKAEKLYAAVPPGKSLSYVAMYTYANMGIPAYCDTVCDTVNGDGVYYCNLYHMDYFRSFESMFYDDKNFDEDEFIEQLAKRRHAILYNHPNHMLCKEFWDKLNYDKINKHPFGQWEECKRRSDADIESFKRKLISLTRKLKADKRFAFKTVSEVIDEVGFYNERKITRDMLLGIRKMLQKELSPIKEPFSLSVSEIFDACEYFIKHEKEDTYAPGKTYGFLSQPKSLDKELKVSSKTLLDTVKNMNRKRFINSEFYIKGEVLGPANMLFLMLDYLCDKSEVLTAKPRNQNVNIDILPNLKTLNLKGTWIHSDDFKDEYLSERLRLQNWTMRF
ncbi:MAG TPA: hypothetical protein VFC76_02030 [Oscillospiraceae bacterium]|nr:hypothetical protein [Oscillospiraceae bacterium]